MQEISLIELENKARELHQNNLEWHFHIMSPSCKYNTESRYAFILEDLTAHKSYVYYSDKAEKETGQKLSPLLHGNKILEVMSDNKYEPSSEIQAMINEMKELNKRNVEWHHHVFFPGCKYNLNPTKFTLILEGRKVLESISDKEPKDALKIIEKLFYSKT